MKFIYIASPYTKGDQFINTRTSMLAFEGLRALGYAPFCPLWSAFQNFLCPMSWEDWMKLDLAWITKCDAVLRLPGESTGADIEVKHAHELGIPVFHSIKQLSEELPA